MAQNVDHERLFFFFFVNLVFHQPHELALFGVQHNGIEHPAADDGRVERALNKIGCAKLVSSYHIGVGIFRRDHDDGDILDPFVTVHNGKHVEPVHPRHDKIEQHERKLHAVAAHIVDGFHAVASIVSKSSANISAKIERLISESSTINIFCFSFLFMKVSCFCICKRNREIIEFTRRFHFITQMQENQARLCEYFRNFFP